MKISELAKHVAIVSRLSVVFGAQGPLFVPVSVVRNTPTATLDAVEASSQEQLSLATWLIKCDMETLNRAGFDAHQIAARYRTLQKKMKGDHLGAWQKAIEQVTGLSIAKVREESKPTSGFPSV